MVTWPAMPLAKPFRALRYDVRRVGPLDALVAPPYDVITPPVPERDPDFEAALDGSRSRLWRLREENEVDAALASLAAPFVIADGHHRYETALRFHEEDG